MTVRKDGMKERRYKVVRLDESLLVDVWNWHLNPPDFLALPISEELPEGTRVVAVNYNPAYRAIEFCVEHESFSPVSPGSMVPAIQSSPFDVRHVAFRDVGKARVDLKQPEHSYKTMPIESILKEASE